MANTGLHRRTQCAVTRQDGRRIICDVIPTKTPGLVVHHNRAGYTVTHHCSGCMIGAYSYATIEGAQAQAVALGLWTEDCPGF